MVYAQRLQEFAPNFLQGERETELWDLSSIDKVPITLMPGKEDASCLYDQALVTQSIIGDKIAKMVPIDDWDHATFSYVADQPFMEKLLAELVIPEPIAEEDNSSNSPSGSDAAVSSLMQATVAAYLSLMGLSLL